MQVTINNFQSIKNASFEVKGLTVITGPNNTGKSACARALAGVFSNPKGYSYVRQGEKNSSVEVQFEDGNHILWEKGKGVNRYEINGNALDKVGASAPDELEDIGVIPVDVDGKEVWPQIARQFEQVFLLDLPPSVLSSALSDVETIKALEQATALARSDVKSVKSRLKIKREDLDNEKGHFTAFFDLGEAEVAIGLVNDLEATLEGVESRIERLKGVLNKRGQLLEEIEALSGVEELSLPPCDVNIDSKIEELKEVSKQRVKLSMCISMIGVGLESYPELPPIIETGELEKWSRVYEKRQTLKEQIEAIEPVVGVCLPDVDVEIEGDVSLCKKALDLHTLVETQEGEVRALGEEAEHLKSHLGGVCPLCEQSI